VSKGIYILLIVVFVIGWTANQAVSQVSDSVEAPLGAVEKEKSSPSDWIKKDQIHVYNDKVIIDLKNSEWAEFKDTNSMDPVFDSESNSIELHPLAPEQLSVGDIVSYRSKYADGIIIHRIIETGYDDSGWYAILKGDNNPSIDPGKIRFSQVEGVVVAVLY